MKRLLDNASTGILHHVASHRTTWHHRLTKHVGRRWAFAFLGPLGQVFCCVTKELWLHGSEAEANAVFYMHVLGSWHPCMMASIRPLVRLSNRILIDQRTNINHREATHAEIPTRMQLAIKIPTSFVRFLHSHCTILPQRTFWTKYENFWRRPMSHQSLEIDWNRLGERTLYSSLVHHRCSMK